MQHNEQGLLFALPSVTKRRGKHSDDIWQFITRPSKMIEDVMIGKVALTDQPEGIQSSCRLAIYDRACRILDLETKLERRAEIGRTPDKLRPYIEAEVMRIWRMRSDES